DPPVRRRRSRARGRARPQRRGAAGLGHDRGRIRRARPARTAGHADGTATRGRTPRPGAGGRAMSRVRDGGSLFWASVILALLLGLLPMPASIAVFKPYWVGLVLCYWLLEVPDRIGLGVAFVLGLAADLVYGTLLGEQAMRLVI